MRSMGDLGLDAFADEMRVDSTGPSSPSSSSSSASGEDMHPLPLLSPEASLARGVGLGSEPLPMAEMGVNAEDLIPSPPKLGSEGAGSGRPSTPRRR